MSRANFIPALDRVEFRSMSAGVICVVFCGVSASSDVPAAYEPAQPPAAVAPNAALISALMR